LGEKNHWRENEGIRQPKELSKEKVKAFTVKVGRIQERTPKAPPAGAVPWKEYANTEGKLYSSKVGKRGQV